MDPTNKAELLALLQEEQRRRQNTADVQTVKAQARAALPRSMGGDRAPPEEPNIASRLLTGAQNLSSDLTRGILGGQADYMSGDEMNHVLAGVRGDAMAAPVRPGHVDVRSGLSRSLGGPEQMPMNPGGVLSAVGQGMRLNAARALNSLNPVMQGRVNEHVFEESGGPAAMAYENALGLQNAALHRGGVPEGMIPNPDVQAGVGQFAAQMAPQMMAGEAMGVLGRAGKMAEAGAQSSKLGMLGQMVKGGLHSTGLMTGLALLGAPEGERLAAAKEAGLDPMNFLMGAVPIGLGSALHTAVDAYHAREQSHALAAQHEAVTSVGNPALSRAVLAPRENPPEPTQTPLSARAAGWYGGTKVEQGPVPGGPVTRAVPGIHPDALARMSDEDRHRYVGQQVGFHEAAFNEKMSRKNTVLADLGEGGGRNEPDASNGSSDLGEPSGPKTKRSKPDLARQPTQAVLVQPEPVNVHQPTPEGPVEFIRHATEEGQMYVRRPGQPKLIQEQVPNEPAAYYSPVNPAELKEGERLFMREGETHKPVTVLGHDGEGGVIIEGARVPRKDGKPGLMLNEVVRPEELRRVNPVASELPSMLPEDLPPEPRFTFGAKPHEHAGLQTYLREHAGQPVSPEALMQKFKASPKEATRAVMALIKDRQYARQPGGTLHPVDPNIRRVMNEADRLRDAMHTDPTKTEFDPVQEAVFKDMVRLAEGGHASRLLDPKTIQFEAGAPKTVFDAEGTAGGHGKKAAPVGKATGTSPVAQDAGLTPAQEAAKLFQGAAEEMTSPGRRGLRKGNVIPPSDPGPEPRGIFASKKQLVAAEARQIMERAAAARNPVPAAALQKPNPVPYVRPPSNFAPNSQLIGDAVARFQKEAAASKGFLQSLMKMASLPEQRAAPLAASAIRGWEAAKRMQDIVMPIYYKQFRAAEARMTPGERMLAEKFIAQNVSPERVLNEGHTQLPESVLPREFLDLYKRGMADMERYRDDLIASGMFTEAQVDRMEALKQNGFAWLHRDFKMFGDNKWEPRTHLVADAIKDLAKKSKITHDEAVSYIQDLLGSHGEGSVQQRFGRSRLNKEILKGREDISPSLRALMGEVHNPSFVLASSMSEIERMWRQLKASETFTAPDYKGQIWDDKAGAAMHPSPIPDDKQAYAAFAGKFVTPELREAIMEAPVAKQQHALTRMWSTFNKAFKTAKVTLSPVTYAINYLSNLTNMAGAGLPMWHSRFAPRQMQAARSLYEFYHEVNRKPSAALTGRPGEARWAEMMLEDGAHRPGMGSDAGGSEAKAIMRRYLREPGDGISGLLDAGSQLMAEGGAKAGAFYDALDSVPRLAVYIEQVTKGLKSGMPMQDARLRAARLVNENFVSSGNQSHAVRAVAGHVGVVNPFMLWGADNLRVHYNWVRNAAKGNRLMEGNAVRAKENLPGLNSGTGGAQAFNVLLHYGLVAGMFKALKYFNSVTDADEAEGEKMLGNSFSKYNPLRTWALGRDEKGRMQALSYGNIFPSNVFLKGADPTKPGDVLTHALWNSVSGWTDGSLGSQTIAQAAKEWGIPADSGYKPDILPGQEGEKGLQSAYELMEPGILTLIRNGARKAQIAGLLRKGEEPTTTAQSIWNMNPITAPFKIEPAGLRSGSARRVSDVAENRNLVNNQKRINGMQGETYDTKVKLRQASHSALADRRQEGK